VTRLAGKAAFLTGGGTGIGRACALLFAREGARVALAGRRLDQLDAAAEEVRRGGGEAWTMTCDVTDRGQVEAAIDATVKRFGKLDVVVNNAGVLLVATAEQTSDADWERVMDTNLRGTFLVSRAALPALRQAGGGAIVNVASILGLVGMKGRAAYAASKGGVVALTRAMALDHASEGIRINCICPAVVDSEMVSELFASQPDPQAARRARIATLPVGRLGTPADVAHLAVYLASEESSWVTGVALPLDGGLTAY
jgi:meso-butanediol dehydrogenase/(S,S)-butanediol dehydrogenase/diacetyl reductase